MSEPKRTSIKLETPILNGVEAIDSIVLRDPAYRDYMELGEPWYLNFTPDGRPFPVDHEPTIAAYIEKCLVEPKNYLLVSQQCTVRDAKALKAWLGRFFREGVADPQAQTEGSTTPSPTSSGTTAA